MKNKKKSNFTLMPLIVCLIVLLYSGQLSISGTLRSDIVFLFSRSALSIGLIFKIPCVIVDGLFKIFSVLFDI